MRRHVLVGLVALVLLAAGIFLLVGKDQTKTKELNLGSAGELAGVQPKPACDWLTPSLLLAFGNAKIDKKTDTKPEIVNEHYNSVCEYNSSEDTVSVRLTTDTYAKDEYAQNFMTKNVESLQKDGQFYTEFQELGQNSNFVLTTSFGKENRTLRFRKGQNVQEIVITNDKEDGSGLAEKLRTMALDIAK